MAGATTLGPPATLNAAGQAILLAPLPSNGSYIITAVYGGDSHFTGSNSLAVTQIVEP
jgi:hypothetical protein